MLIRRAELSDAEAACDVLRRSIAELCGDDHRGVAATLAAWLANKTPDIVRRWIGHQHVFVAEEYGAILGVAALAPTGEVTLNYVSPDARFRGASKALMARLEDQARVLGHTTLRLTSTATARRFYAACGYADAGPPVVGYGTLQGYPMAKPLAGA